MKCQVVECCLNPFQSSAESLCREDTGAGFHDRRKSHGKERRERDRKHNVLKSDVERSEERLQLPEHYTGKRGAVALSGLHGAARPAAVRCVRQGGRGLPLIFLFFFLCPGCADLSSGILFSFANEPAGPIQQIRAAGGDEESRLQKGRADSGCGDVYSS